MVQMPHRAIDVSVADHKIGLENINFLEKDKKGLSTRSNRSIRHGCSKEFAILRVLATA